MYYDHNTLKLTTKVFFTVTTFANYPNRNNNMGHMTQNLQIPRYYILYMYFELKFFGSGEIIFDNYDV